jgi:hypothetical protein
MNQYVLACIYLLIMPFIDTVHLKNEMFLLGVLVCVKFVAIYGDIMLASLVCITKY